MFAISSPAFRENEAIPQRYTCDGENINPPLSISGVPAEAESLILFMDDPDIPSAVKDAIHADVFDHWVVFDMPPGTERIPENRMPPGTEGSGTRGSVYTGPCPPDREHRYFFRLYALDTVLGLPAGAARADIERAMEGHIIGSAELVGRYNRMRNRPS